MEVKIESLKKYNMSNWEATHTFDTLNTANNKNNILKSMSEYLNNSEEKNNIFIFDSSFKINNNYNRYFNNGNILSLNIVDDIQNIMYMGKIIPFEYNEELSNIQYIFNSYKSLNYIVQNYKDSKVRRNKYVDENLIKYLKMISKFNIQTIFLEMYTYCKETLMYLHSQKSDDDEKLYNDAINKLSQKYDNIKSNYNKFINNCKHTSNNKFLDNFSNFSRPIICIYNSKERTIKVINSDQMYKKGENCNNELGLISIRRNSPIKINVKAVGIMQKTFNYLLFSEHNKKVNCNNDDLYINDDELILKIFNSNDSDINILAKRVLNKIKEVTSNKIVSLSLIN